MDAGAALLQRLDAAARRLQQRAGDEVGGDRLTDPDRASGERWEPGQVWAHLAEFVPYWIEQARAVVDGYTGEPVPFGRTKADAGRIAAIENDRRTAVAALNARLQSHVVEARVFLQSLPESAWSASGVHSTLGVMSVERILDEFIVGHLEEHATQLDRLAG
jgi:DinB family protein